ncbi:MAG: AAA family ATPase, partial [Candidatus Hydrogenedentota bacterium]
MTNATTVTVLCTDVVGSTGLRTGWGDESAHRMSRAHFELIRQQIEQHNGQQIKTIGDSFMAAFGSVRRAVDCAVALQRALTKHNRRDPDQQIQVRIGLNIGEAIEEGGDLFGAAVDAAVCIASKAAGGQILVSESLRGVIGSADDVELVDRGLFRLKGLLDRWRLYEIVWQQEETPAALALATLADRTPFVGREGERATLQQLLGDAAKGQGSLVMIGGEPGLGKTRLAEELVSEARQSGFLTLTGHCYEMEGAPSYIPFVELIESAARLVESDALLNALGDSAPEVAKLMPELRRLFPDIPPAPELPPEHARRYLFNGVREFVARAARAQPLLLVLDDLQWADEPTLLLLEHVAQQLREMPVFIIGTYRDVEWDAARSLAETLEGLLRQRLTHKVILKPLPQSDVSAMLRARSGQEPPAPLVHAVFRETEGNPFFVEEVF